MPSNDQVVVDLSNYKDKVGARVPKGRYRVLVADAEADKSNQGNDMIQLWLDIQGGDYDGQTLVDRLTQTPNSLFRTVAFMRAIGLPTPKKRLVVKLNLWIGKVLEVDVEDGDPYKGTVKSEVRGYIMVPKTSSARRTDVPADDDPLASTEDPWAGEGLGEFAENAVPTEAETQQAGVSRPEAGKAAAELPSSREVPDTVDLDDLDL